MKGSANRDDRGTVLTARLNGVCLGSSGTTQILSKTRIYEDLQGRQYNPDRQRHAPFKYSERRKCREQGTGGTTQALGTDRAIVSTVATLLLLYVWRFVQ